MAHTLTALGPTLGAAIMGILEKIADIEREMARTQKNKGAPYQAGRVDSAQQAD